jgi:flagellar operon protein
MSQGSGSSQEFAGGGVRAEKGGRAAEAARQAGERGIKDSLILVDQLAFIVNVPNHTVVTAMDQTENKSNVFTNIDGAVIA